MDNLSSGTHTFTVDGTRQVYHVAGTGPVLIAHSGGPGAGYAYLRSERLEERFTMVYPEPVGTGESGPLPEGATYVDTYAQFLAALVDHLSAPQVRLLGHSHGGFVALRYTLDHPDRVAGLVLYSTSPTTGPEFGAARTDAIAKYLRRHADLPEVSEVQEALGRLGTVTTHTDKTRALAAALPVYFADFWGERRVEYEKFQAELRAWVARFEDGLFDARADLGSITAPTVVLTGRHDFVCGPRWAEMLHNGIPGSRLVILENSGHFAQTEEPEAFVEAVSGVLRP